MSSDTPRIEISQCPSCGRDMNPTDDRDRLRRELAAVTAEWGAYDKRLAAALKVPGCHPEEMLNVIDSLMAAAAERDALQERVTELNHAQRIQDSTTAAVMERAEAECAALRKELAQWEAAAPSFIIAQGGKEK